jgi:hypothetical protein
MSTSLDFNLFIIMTKKKTSKLSTFKKNKPLERKVADDLVRLHERNEKLREKEIGTSFLDLF